MLGSEGRLAIISFHSLEDRIVKRGLQLESGRCLCNVQAPKALQPRGSTPGNPDELICPLCGARTRVRILTRKPIRANREEIERNLFPERTSRAFARDCDGSSPDALCGRDLRFAVHAGLKESEVSMTLVPSSNYPRDVRAGR